ncbi:alanine racemase [Paenilisteria rocourtiae]|uniref:Alanine racemase n=1 Tax=Listeria rocourtiae TaxID=647910 RepID=A0A4R6ZSN2_9LIST|nr:alanine racemase [Listeria rocourtiae]EUJ43839.1 alanine racemase [Listeria rocourtiae FSL F6-920]TDR55615.1 alanine racemase [Listeria rocourtiae]
MAVTGWHRPTWVEIDCAAIQANIQNEQAHLPDDVALFAVVKADAYGHGMLEVAKTAKKAGAKGFCVAILDEALALREAGFDDFILVMGAVPQSFARLAAEKQIALTVFDLDWLTGLELLPVNLDVHVKVDTGMGRLGLRSMEAVREIEAEIVKREDVTLDGIFTHFATADQLETSYFEKQLACFREVVASMVTRPTWVHCANSATALLHDQVDFDAVRFGISMYGLTPSPEIIPVLPFELRPALSWYTEMVQVKELFPGDCVSYGATYEANEREWVATLPVGYADGFIRAYSGFEVSVDGVLMPVIGRVCMDQCIIKLPHKYSVGTKVTLIGSPNSADVAARHLNTINYEVTCLISERVPKKYI